MRLNPDCIREILLCIEDNTGYNTKGIDYNEVCDILENFSNNEVKYHINQCEHFGFIYITAHFIGGNALISDLTPQGHEFLANIRSNTNWNKTKEISKNIGSVSLKALSDIAANVISNLISKSF